METGFLTIWVSVISTVISAVIGAIVFLYNESQKCFKESVQNKIDKALLEEKLRNMSEHIAANREATLSATQTAATAATTAATAAAVATAAVANVASVTAQPAERPSGTIKSDEQVQEKPYTGEDRRKP